MKTVLLSHIPLPYSGIASWTTMMNYLLSKKNSIDYIICPTSTIKTENVTQLFFSPKQNNLSRKILQKITKKTKYDNYTTRLKTILLSENKIIVQIVDNLGLLKEVQKFVSKNQLQSRVYVQFFFHGFSPFYPEDANLYSKIDELILLSNSSYKIFKEKCNSLPVKIVVNHNGIDSESFKRITLEKKIQLRKKHEVNKDKLIFIWCSQDRKKKGLNVAIEAFNTVQKKSNLPMELLVIGCTKEIKIPNIKIVGRIPNKELPEYYQLSDFYLFPTLCHEGFGLSLAEALKCGTYCIAANNGSVPEVLQYGNYGKLIDCPNIIENWVVEIEKSIIEYKQTGNPYLKNIPDNLYDMEDWRIRYNTIIEQAKINFNYRFYTN